MEQSLLFDLFKALHRHKLDFFLRKIFFLHKRTTWVELPSIYNGFGTRAFSRDKNLLAKISKLLNKKNLYLFSLLYWVTQKLPEIYTANHDIPIQIRKITVQICGNFWVTQYVQDLTNYYNTLTV